MASRSSIGGRRYPRYEMGAQLHAINLAAPDREVRGQSLNINEGGMAALFARGWEVGTHVNLQFSVPVTTSPLSLNGVARNRTGYRHGFEMVSNLSICRLSKSA
jgi:hypothetical protein